MSGHLAEIERSVDPCGETSELANLVRAFRACADGRYRICLTLESERNFTEPDATTATITWNPELRTELERGCGGQSDRPVLRDPVASLLHEMVHVVQHCRGLDPTANEFDAVRIENVYRRSRGLCQRTRYGDEPLPPAMRVACDPGACTCAPRVPAVTIAAGQPEADTARVETDAAAGDAVPRPSLPARAAR